MKKWPNVLKNNKTQVVATLMTLEKIVEKNLRQTDVKTLLIIERIGAAGMNEDRWRKNPRTSHAWKRVLRELRMTDDIPHIRVKQIYPSWKKRAVPQG